MTSLSYINHYGLTFKKNWLPQLKDEDKYKMRNFQSFVFFILCCLKLHLGKCSTKIPILRHHPVKNCPDNQCTVKIPIKSSLPLNEFSFCGKYNFKFLKEVQLMYLDGPDSYVRFYDFDEKMGMVMHNGNVLFFSNVKPQKSNLGTRQLAIYLYDSKRWWTCNTCFKWRNYI